MINVYYKFGENKLTAEVRLGKDKIKLILKTKNVVEENQKFCLDMMKHSIERKIANLLEFKPL